KLEEFEMPRPMTHDLLLNVIRRLGGEVERLLIDDLWNNTFYAKICINTGEEVVEIDCRPSDGIALALRAEVPIVVADAVMEEGRWPTAEEQEEEQDEEEGIE
ncbi:MAG TPA: bifunctional nuclease family protein, partial [Armatimonadetes bacterium]|nr:bifunctional nuclease family protein [Armatimonadota bacterium]